MAPFSCAHSDCESLDSRHAGGVDAQRQFEVGRGHGGEILGDGLLGIGIVVAAELGVDGGDLIARNAAASAKQHVLLGVGRAGKSGGRFLAAREDSSVPR